MTTHLPHGDGGVGRARHHLVVFGAGVQSPHFVLVGVQRLHALVGLDGPQLHQTVGAAAKGAVTTERLLAEFGFGSFVEQTAAGD